MHIREYQADDFNTLQCWWGNSPAKPTEDMLPPDTFVLEIDGQASVSACLYLTNNKYAAMIEHLVANPALPKETRHEAVAAMFEFLEAEARSRGYRYLTIFSFIDRLKARYENLGYRPTRSNITTFCKAL